MLENIKGYLAGPIGGCTWEESWGWRILSQKALDPIKIFNPCRREYQEPGKLGFRGDELKQMKAWTSKEIVALDKAEIGSSDFVLAHFFEPAAGSYITGTTMEIIHGFDTGKLVVVVTKFNPIHSWIDYHAHRVYDNFDDAHKFILDFYK